MEVRKREWALKVGKVPLGPLARSRVRTSRNFWRKIYQNRIQSLEKFKNRTDFDLCSHISDLENHFSCSHSCLFSSTPLLFYSFSFFCSSWWTLPKMTQCVMKSDERKHTSLTGWSKLNCVLDIFEGNNFNVNPLAKIRLRFQKVRQHLLCIPFMETWPHVCSGLSLMPIVKVDVWRAGRGGSLMKQ